MAATILNSVQQHGGRVSRYGDFTMVFMHGGGFITTPMEYLQMTNWARGRVSSGNPVRDRTTFVDRFETVLGRVGSGIASKGSRGVLARIVKSMKANAVFLEEWSIPRDLDQGVEVKKQAKPMEPEEGHIPGTFAACNDVMPATVTPLRPK